MQDNGAKSFTLWRFKLFFVSSQYKYTTESSFVVNLDTKKNTRLEWMRKSGTSWQMLTFKVTLALYTRVNTHLHRSHLLWLATQVVRNNNNNFTLHFRISMLFLLFYYVTFDYRTLVFINWQLLMVNTVLLSERAA